jgi:quercetin dioxygenase-like cupin family protein
MTADLDWPTEAGVLRPEPFEVQKPDGANVSLVYQDQDINVVVWNLLPGQETDVHKHPENAHTFIILKGQGEYTREADTPVPIRAGDFVIIPRETVHLIVNTGSEPMSYLAVSSIGPHGYTRA